MVGGVEKHVAKLNTVLRTRGYRVTVITEQSQSSLPSEETIDGVKVYRLPVTSATVATVLQSISFKVRLWYALWKIRKQWQGAARLHVHDVFFWLLPFWPLIKQKAYITFHGYEGSDAPNWRQVLWHRLAAAATQANLCIGDFHKKWYSIKPDMVSYGAVTALSPQQLKRPSKKSVLKLLYIGRLHEDTGCLAYLHAAKLLQSKGVSFTLTIMGDGPLKAAVSRYIQKHTLPVTMEGFVEGAAQHIPSYDILFVSRYLAILEALAAGKPVIAHYNTAIKYEYLAAAPFAKWIEIVATPKEIAAAVQTVDLSSRQAAVTWAAGQTWEKMADTYEQLWYETTSK